MSMWENVKANDLVMSEITVVVDDYDTGEVLYEGTVNGSYVMGMHLRKYPKSVEWSFNDGQPVAFVTIKLGEKLEALKRVLAAGIAFKEFDNEPVYEGLNRDERRALMEQRRPEHERLWHECISAQAEFEGWELIEE